MDEHSARTSFWQEGNSKWLLLLVLLEFLPLPWMAPSFLPAQRNSNIIIVVYFAKLFYDIWYNSSLLLLRE